MARPHYRERSGSPLISVVIATTCEKSRELELRRAIDSALTQEGVNVALLIVVNGTRYDPDLLRDLRDDARLCVFYRTEGSFPAALRFGREVLTGQYFSFLDDDDVLLPGALRLRLQALDEDPPADVVCTNGHVESSDGTRPLVGDVALVTKDPLRAHFRFNWLGSSAALYRASTITPDFFDGVTKHYEWTWLTHRLLTSRRLIRFVDVPTFRKHDTPGSLSKDPSVDPLMAELRLIELMLHDAPPSHRALLRSKARACLHSLAAFHCEQGRLGQAWSFHVRSLFQRGGWRHLLFTRKIVRESLRHLRHGGGPARPGARVTGHATRRGSA